MLAAPPLRFIGELHRCTTLDELVRVFSTGFGRVLDVPMYGFNVVQPGTTRLRATAAVGVSDVFVNTYIRDVMDADPLRVGAHESGHAVYSLGLMSADEWEESDAYRTAFSMHRMRHVVEAPMLAGGRPIGSLHFGTAGGEHDLGPADLRTAESMAGVIAQAVAAIDARERLTLERDELRAALDVAGLAVVLSGVGGLRLNETARRLLWDVVDADERVYRLLALRPGDGAFSRHVDVELASGEAATLHGDCTPVGAEGALVAVLALRREHPRVSPAVLATLTPREAEVANLVVEGLADREIAEHLCLSHHTVSQYVKRIYRRLGVDSRVTLTRLLLGVPRTRGG